MKLAEITGPLLGWYAENARKLPWREQVTPYRVWVSEIMLQQTRVEAVKAYFLRFTETLPDIAALAFCPEQQLLKLWEGLGYYSRVRNLQKAAQTVMERYDGALPADADALRGLSGIGPYTAGAIASIAFDLPEPAVDGNVLRVYSRLTASRADIADQKTKRAVEDALREIMPAGHAGAFNQSLMELGATVCVPNGPPDCGSCPLGGLCMAKARGIAAELPVKTAKKARRIEELTVLMLVRDGCIAIRRRPEHGLLAGLWEPPSVDGFADRKQAAESVRGLGLEPLRMEELGAAKHIFTHVEWHMRGLRITVEDRLAVEGLTWVTPESLRKEYPLPSAFRAFMGPWMEQNL